MVDLNVTYVSLSIIVILLATIQDIKQFAISNILTFTGMLSGLVLHMAFAGYIGFEHALEGLIVGFVMGEIAAFLTKMGQGDVFLFATIGSFLGPMLVGETYLVTFTILFIRFAPSFMKNGFLRRRIAVAPYIATSALIVLIIKQAIG